MSENKHYGRQILLSLFLTVFVLLALLYVASRYLLPLYSINQEQIYEVLIKLFPLLIGLVMIEIGVLVARKRDEDYADAFDKLPPNAYDRPLYTLPGDDPLHTHSDEMVFSQSLAPSNRQDEYAPSMEEVQSTPVWDIEPVQQTPVAPTPVVPQPVTPIVEEPVAPLEKPTVTPEVIVSPPRKLVEVTLPTIAHDFNSILDVELDNAQEMEYDLTLVLVDVTRGPAHLIGEKIITLSEELAYSFTLDDGKIAMILPFYNAEEARSFTLTLLESCKKEFSGASLQIGFASRNGRVLDSSLLLHEAVTACSLEEEDQEEV